MDKEYVQHLRYKLQKRIRRLNSIDYPLFHVALDHVWQWITSQVVFADILSDLAKRYPEAENEAQRISKGEALLGDSEIGQVALAAAVLKMCVTAPNAIERNIERLYKHSDSVSLEVFKEHFLEPVYEYLDEQLDDQRALLALLRKYKQKCEWFQREALFKTWADDTRRGEKHLAMHLYEYLHDQGLEFTIEPSSASGEADLIAAQSSNDPLIADAKIFDTSRNKGKNYLVKGFQQVYHRIGASRFTRLIAK